ncbi:exportin-5, partial [Thraustotheca clavata]
MDKGMYEQLLVAVDVCHASMSSQDERNAAYSYCEQFQSRSDCVSYALFILQNDGHANHHRHFALHVLEIWLRTHWKSISQEDIVSYRTSLLTVVASYLSQDEPSYIKEKIVRVLADIAKRQFPQRWPDLLDQLMQLWQLGSVQVEIVMLLFRSIAEDCVSSSFNSTIPPTRRKDILQGLNACFNALFPQVYQQLEYQYAALQQPTTELHKQANAVLLATLQMMKEFLDWMPVATAAAPDTNFIAVASLMLVAPQLSVNIRIAAAECLEVFFSRNFGKENLSLLVAASESCWAHLNQIPLNVNEVDDNDELMLHMHINRILVSWGTHQLELLIGEFPASHEVLAPFVQLLAVLYKHPSLQITEAQVIVWLNLLKQTKIVNALLVQQIIPLLWTTSVEKYFKLNSPDRESANATSQLEFEDHEAYTTFFSNFRGRIYGILRLLIQLQPDVGLAQLHNRLEFVLTQYPRGTDALNELGHCTELSTAHLYHEGIISLTDCIMKSLPEHALTIDANLNQLKLTVELMLCYQTTDPWLLFRNCLGLSLFSKYYMRDTSMYPCVFERLFALIVFCQPGEIIHGAMDPTTMNVRRRALASLVSICHASPSHVLPFLNILCTKVISLFPVVLDSESVLMYEMLVLVSNSLPTTEERHNFIAQITAEPLATWTSPDMTRIVSSPAELVRSIETKDDTLVFGIVKVLTTLYGIAKRIQTDLSSSHPFTTVWPVLLPNLLALLRTLHCLPLERAAIL